MKLCTTLTTLAGLHAGLATPAHSSPPTHILTNPDPHSHSTSSSSLLTSRIPSSYESAILGRRILALTPLATLSTVFPNSYSSPTEDADGLPHSILLEHRPPGLGGVPIGLMDYVADCEQPGGNPTILAISIATSFKNVAAGSNMSISINWAPPYPPKKRIESTNMLNWVRDWFDRRDRGREYDPVPYSAANLPRYSLLGYLEPIAVDSVEEAGALQSCFLKSHPDAKYWLPGNRIHASEWVRLVVTQVYWIGGFGDRAYIGWIPIEEWRNVTKEEWEAIRLPGEKPGWDEWSITASELEL